MNLSMMFYGEPGMGKTVLACSALDVPELNPVLLLDVESNVLSVKSKLNFIELSELGKKTESGKIDRVSIRSTSDVQAVLDYLDANPNVYKTVAVDSLTELSYVCLGEFAGKGKIRKKATEVTPFEIQHYGYNMLLLKQVLTFFKQLDVTVLYTALEDIDKIEGEVVMKVRPDFPGKLSRELIAKVDIVGNLSIKPGSSAREIRFQPTSRVVAKDQSENGKLGATMENPTMKKIMEKLNG